MTGLEVQLAERIDDALRILSPGGNPGAPDALRQLSALAGEYLGHSLTPPVRSAATEIASFEYTREYTQNPGAGLAPEDETRFRQALTSLRHSIEEQKKLEVATSQFADDPELVQDFIVEAREHLANVEAGLLTLEQEPDNAEALNGVFRSFHTIKGLAAFLGASSIQELAHNTESVLDLARSGALAVSPGFIDGILLAADQMNRFVGLAGTTRMGDIPRCDQSLLDGLAALARGEESSPAAPAPQTEAAPAAEVAVPAQQTTAAPAAEPAVQHDAPRNVTPETPQSRTSQKDTFRVDALKLEYLIDMVGELVIAESVVRHDPGIAQAQDAPLARNLTQLARVVQEVQKTSMSMRMVVVGAIFQKMNRLVRDLSRKSGKPADLVTFGDDVELDRGIVDDLADPMVHMIRNSMDHGLETPDERRQVGKPERGTLRLKAMHDAGDIVIELSDDGRGLDPAKILAKAKKAGLVGAKDQPDDDAIFRFIFEPGFSTAEKVTDLSGRGVGLDVVKRQVQKLRGRIAIHSTPGRGCTFVLRLPLTLAIIDGLVVGVGAQRYILPMFAVREMFAPGPDTFITVENRAEAALFRDKLLPVIRLSRLLEKDAKDKGAEDRVPGVLIVAEARDQVFCIAVDQLIGKQEVVIKSLGKTYRDVPAISGGSILGDGRVGLIIDVNSLRYQS